MLAHKRGGKVGTAVSDDDFPGYAHLCYFLSYEGSLHDLQVDKCNTETNSTN